MHFKAIYSPFQASDPLDSRVYPPAWRKGKEAPLINAQGQPPKGMQTSFPLRPNATDRKPGGPLSQLFSFLTLKKSLLMFFVYEWQHSMGRLARRGDSPILNFSLADF